MVDRHCPPNRHGLSTSYRKGEFARGGVRWVDVSEAKRWLRGVGKGATVADCSLSLSLSLHRAIHGGVKHGEMARMIDGILRCCGHGMGNPTILAIQQGETPLLDIDKSATPPGGQAARGIP